MGVDAVLLAGDYRRVRDLPDPAGGTFDAAGDFDRLLGQVPDATMWSSIDPIGDTTLTAEQARALATPLLESPWRFIDEAAVKWRHDDPDADALYRYAQERSRLLAGRGSSLTRADIDQARTAAGERPWSAVAAARAAGHAEVIA